MIKMIRKRMSGHRRRGSEKTLVRSRVAVRTQRTPRKKVRAVTIKCIDKTDGTTVWEYGPGSFWRHHYGADAITGVVPDLAATLDKYAIGASSYPSFSPCGNRNSATLVANVAEALSVVKLNAIDGTTIESATLTGLFCDLITETAVGLVAGQSITNAAGLSGGDFFIVGERIPFVEFVDFTSNAATKEYILHAHGLRDGNVYLKTRTSNETITIPFDSTASEVETLFEATADCVTATATGGPWPLLPITVEVEWSASGGDISAIATTGTYSLSAGGVEWDYSNDTLTEVGVFTLTTTSVVVGAQFRLTFPRGDQFTYTSTTENISDFAEDFRDALRAWIAESSAQSGLIPDDNGANITNVGNVLSINFVNVFPDNGPIVAEVIAGGEGVTSSRRAGMCAASYDTGTGEMTSAVGFEFGRSEVEPASEMFEEASPIPDVTGLSLLGIQCIGSGPSNSVICSPRPRGNGDLIRASVVEAWTITDGVWDRLWQSHCNATIAIPDIIQCESGYVVCPIFAKIFDSVRERTAARLQVSDGTIEELLTTFGSISPPDNNVLTAMFDGTPGSYFSWAYDLLYQDQYVANNRFRVNGHGADTWINGTEYRLGAQAFGCDGISVFGTLTAGISGGWRYDGLGDSADSLLYIKFFAPPNSRAAEPQQFRFKITKMPGTNYTSWLDWYSTKAEIETALNTLLGSGNCSIIDFGGLADPVENDPLSLIECNPMIEFKTDTGFSPGSGRIPGSYFTFRNDGEFVGLNDVLIEMRNITPFADPPGIAAFSASDASFIWSRPFGTAGSVTVAQPLYAWLQGDYVYAYGQLVDDEL